MFELFLSLPTWGLLLSILATVLVLAASADKMVDGASSLAHYSGISPLIIGVTIVSLGTTVPEMVVSVLAAFYGDSSLALGNGVGSIIVDTAFIMGLLILSGRVVLEKRAISATSWWRDLSATALVALAWLLPQQILPRWLGFLALVVLAVFLLQTYWHQMSLKKQGQGHRSEEADPHLGLGQSVLYLLLGLALVVLSSRLLLPQAAMFALRLGVSQDIIATTLIAFGTSLPELSTTLAAIRKKKEALAVGNIMGADILNSLFVIGAAAATHPIRVDLAFFRLHFPVMLLILWSLRLLLLGQFRRQHYSIPRWYGLLLILIYISYVFWQYIGGVELI